MKKIISLLLIILLILCGIPVKLACFIIFSSFCIYKVICFTTIQKEKKEKKEEYVTYFDCLKKEYVTLSSEKY